MCKKNFKLDIDLQMLHFKADKDSGFMTALDDDENALAYFGVGDGAEIYMNELDVKSLAKEKAKAEKEQDERMKAEEAGVKAMRDAKVLEVNAEKSAVSAAGGR